MGPDAALAWLTILQAARGEPAWQALLAAEGSAEAVLGLADRRLEQAGLDAAAIRRLRAPDHGTVRAWQAWLERPRHALITRGGPGYPPLLAAVDRPPLALWANGPRPELLGAPQIAIVGSRQATQGGCRTAEQFARYLAESGITITSGLAAGIDAAGHRGALGTAAGTVAVLGCGIDVIFPRSNRQLARAVAAEGLVVSEYPPGVAPRAWQFPARNRIIAGLALGTLVVEAGRRSGALITAGRALDFGREVFAIPGSIHNPLSRGCHALIKQGAKLVEEGADILVEVGMLLGLEAPAGGPPGVPEPASSAGSRDRDPAYATVLEALGYAPTDVAELASRSGLTAAELSSMLLILELEGFVEALPGGRYCRLPARSR